MSSVDYIKIFQGEDGDFYWGAYAANHEEVSQSEGYTRLYDAGKAAKAVFPGVRVEVDIETGSTEGADSNDAA